MFKEKGVRVKFKKKRNVGDSGVALELDSLQIFVNVCAKLHIFKQNAVKSC